MTERARSNTFISATDTDAKAEPEPGLGLDTELEDSNHGIERSLNPAEVRIGTTYSSVRQLVLQIRQGEIYWDSDVQRSFAWQPKYRSRLVESLLLRIPIPEFYVATDESNKWSVIDGTQRLSAIFSYVTDEYSLIRLEYFSQLNGMGYSDLPRSMQRRIDETQLTVHIVEAGTPEHVRLNIFRRINPRRCEVEKTGELDDKLTNA